MHKYSSYFTFLEKLVLHSVSVMRSWYLEVVQVVQVVQDQVYCVSHSRAH